MVIKMEGDNYRLLTRVAICAAAVFYDVRTTIGIIFTADILFNHLNSKIKHWRYAEGIDEAVVPTNRLYRLTSLIIR